MYLIALRTDFSVLFTLKVPLSPKTNRDSEGLYISNKGAPIPQEIADETIEFLWTVHEDANKFSRNPDQVTIIPKSMGHYFEERFQDWLETEKSSDLPEVMELRKQLFYWFLKFEECDTGMVNRDMVAWYLSKNHVLKNCKHIIGKSALHWGIRSAD